MNAHIRATILFAGILTIIPGCSKPYAGENPPLGKDIRTKEVHRFLAAFKTEPEITRYDEMPGSTLDMSFYSYKAEGVSVGFEADILVNVSYYAEGADGFRQYHGRLPKGISLTDTSKDIEAKLGLPDSTSGSTECATIEIIAAYFPMPTCQTCRSVTSESPSLSTALRSDHLRSD